jgi:hypothetical protein
MNGSMSPISPSMRPSAGAALRGVRAQGRSDQVRVLGCSRRKANVPCAAFSPNNNMIADAEKTLAIACATKFGATGAATEIGQKSKLKI